MSDTPKTPEGQAPSAIIERAARVRYAAWRDQRNNLRLMYEPWELLPQHERDQHVSHMRAAIKEMREPTEEMVEAGKRAAISVLARMVKPEQAQTLVYTGVQEYRAMIDAACGRKP